MAGPLGGVRVLDACQLAVGPLAAAWLGQLGADVIKIESPTGDPIRGLKPDVGGVGTYYSAVNLNKRSIVLDLKRSDDRAVALDLAQRSDVFLQNLRPGVMERLGLGYSELASANPRLVYGSCSGYGTTGPRRAEGGGDTFIRLFTGFDTVNGPLGGSWERLRNRGHIDHVTSAYFLQAILAGLLWQRRTGRGQLVEASMMQSTIAYQTTVLAEFLATGTDPLPSGSIGRWWCPDQAFLVKDGYLALTIRADHEWRDLCECVGILPHDPLHDLDAPARVARRDEVIATLAPRLLSRTCAEWVSLLARHSIACAPFTSLEEVIQHPHTMAHHLVVDVEHPWGTVRVAREPWTFSGTPAFVRRAPSMDEHGPLIRSELTIDLAESGASAAEHSGRDVSDRPILRGVRVLEVLSTGIAVPYAGMQAVQLGASVLKVEPPNGDVLREAAPRSIQNENIGSLFAELNRGKRCVALGTADDEGAAQLATYVQQADVVITDLADDDLRRIGIGYEQIRENNRGVILCQLTGFGSDGPWAGHRASELAVQAASGIWQYLGSADSPPTRLGVDVAETAGGVMALQGILAAMIERAETGDGQRVEVSELGAMLALQSHLIAAHSDAAGSGGWHLPAPDFPIEYPVYAADAPVDVSLPDEFAFTEFYRTLGVPDELCEDARFTEKLAIIINWESYLKQIGPFIRRWPAERVKELAGIYGGMGVVGHRYSTLSNDPQVREMKVFLMAGTGLDATAYGLGAPWRFEHIPICDDSASPILETAADFKEWESGDTS